AASGRATGTGAGADGSVALDWVECAYDLAVVKSVSVGGTAVASGVVVPAGSVATWTIAVTNNGPDAMTRGDLLTIADAVPGSGATEITSITVAGGSNARLESGAVSCDASVGDAMPTSLECARPYQRNGATASGSRGLNVGETLTVRYTQTIA